VWWRTERARPEVIRVRPGAWKLAVATVCFGAFMGQLDASVVTLVYRPVGIEFHTALAGVEWVSLAYLLTLIALLVPAGRMSDARGRKLFYLYGFVVFTAASAACGLAPSLWLLVLFRVMQAVGAALLQANSVALVTTSAPADRRRQALGIQAGAQALGLALGPTVGGILVATVGWRWVFMINVPVGVVALVAGHYLLPRTHHRHKSAGLDWPSVVLLAVATTGLLFGISAASGLSLPLEILGGSVAIAAISAWGFIDRQRSVIRPLVELDLFADGVIGWGLVAAMGGYLILFGPLVLIPIVLTARGISALTSGLVLTALPAGFALAAVVGSAVLPDSLSESRRALLGMVVCGAGLAVALVAPFTPACLVVLLAVMGVGLGVLTPSNNAMIMGAVPPGSTATGGGLLNLTRGLGTALGVGLVTLGLHLGAGHGGLVAGGRLVIMVLLAVAVLTAMASHRASGTCSRPQGGAGHLLGRR
jgi:MFS family permease